MTLFIFVLNRCLEWDKSVLTNFDHHCTAVGQIIVQFVSDVYSLSPAPKSTAIMTAGDDQARPSRLDNAP